MPTMRPQLSAEHISMPSDSLGDTGAAVVSAPCSTGHVAADTLSHISAGGCRTCECARVIEGTAGNTGSGCRFEVVFTETIVSCSELLLLRLGIGLI